MCELEIEDRVVVILNPKKKYSLRVYVEGVVCTGLHQTAGQDMIRVKYYDTGCNMETSGWYSLSQIYRKVDQ